MHDAAGYRVLLGLALALLLVPGLAAAQERWYQVELVVFRHLDYRPAETEFRPALKEFPSFRNSIELLTELPDFEDEPAFAAAAAAEEVAYRRLDSNELLLNGLVRRLRGSADYRPLYHVGWRQPAGSAATSRRVYVNSLPEVTGEAPTPPPEPLGAPPDEERVEGTIRLKVADLLYIETDFLFFDGGEYPVRLQENRRVKLKELHYFDHSLFGLLVQVTPYRTAAAEGDAVSAQDATAVSGN